jgi:hypothetical protein
MNHNNCFDAGSKTINKFIGNKRSIETGVMSFKLVNQLIKLLNIF